MMTDIAVYLFVNTTKLYNFKVETMHLIAQKMVKNPGEPSTDLRIMI